MISKMYYNDLKKVLKASFKNGIAVIRTIWTIPNYGLTEALLYTLSNSKTRPFKLSKCLKGGVLSVLNKYLGFYLFK